MPQITTMIPLNSYVLIYLHKVANNTTLEPHLLLISFIPKAVRADRVLTIELDTLLWAVAIASVLQYSQKVASSTSVDRRG
jgi:hypothetical protein